MGNVVEFPPRLAGPDPQHESIITILDVQLSLAASAKMLTSSLVSLRESLQNTDALICYIDDAEARERLRLKSASIYLEVLNAAQKVLNAAAVCQKRSV